MAELTAENTTKKGTSRKKKFINWKSLLIVILPAVAAVAAVVVVYLTTHKASGFMVDGDAFQTYAGGTRDIANGTVLRHKEDGSGVMVLGNTESDLSDLVLYFKDRNAILTPIDMVIYEARTTTPRKLDYFSEVSVEADGVYLKRSKQKVAAPLGFLYDGSDMYVFLEPVKISWRDYEEELDALSYVEAVLGEHVMIYNHATGKTYLEESPGEVTVEAANGDYTMQLMYDSMQLANGTKVLLFGRTEKLDSIYD